MEKYDETDDLPSASQDDLPLKDGFAQHCLGPAKEQTRAQDITEATELTGRERDSESCVSETSDHLLDFESLYRNPKDNLGETSMNGDTDTPLIGMGTLDQMKAIYSNFLGNLLRPSMNLKPTLPLSQSSVNTEKPSRSNSTSSSSSCSSTSYDWHQSAVAKTIQQHPPHSHHAVHSEHNLFSTVQFHRQNPKLFGSVFTGASKFRCKRCSAAYDTLVELTVHMNDTGHYHDDNTDRTGNGGNQWSKPRKRSLLEMEGKEDAQKVLRCMYCGHSFESLQDLSVHMIKTKHYQKMPLKGPIAPVASKIMSSKKKGQVSLEINTSPHSKEGTHKARHPQIGDQSELSWIFSTNPYTSPNNHYELQNDASFAWEFESNKFQILMCMDCGSSHNTLQELKTHMMLTGHFLTGSSSVGKKKAPPEVTSPKPLKQTSPTDQSVTLTSSYTLSPQSQTPSTPSATFTSPTEIKKEEDLEKCCNAEQFENGMDVSVLNGKVDDPQKEEKFGSSKYNCLSDTDPNESPKGGFDILKSLENTVTSAINKAQNTNPSCGGYPSIHAAYQFPSVLKLQQGSMEKIAQKFFSREDDIASSLIKSQLLISPPLSHSPPFHNNTVYAMELTGKIAKEEQRIEHLSPKIEDHNSSYSIEVGEMSKEVGDSSPREWRAVIPVSSDCGSHANRASPLPEAVKCPTTLRCSVAINNGHRPPEQPVMNPLRALQSVLNVHLGKAAKSNRKNQDPLSSFPRLNSVTEQVSVSPLQTQNLETEIDVRLCQPADDEPIDLTKGKNTTEKSVFSQMPSPSASSASDSNVVSPAKSTMFSPHLSSSPLHENALSDISDMLRNLTQSHHVPKILSRTRVTDKVEIKSAAHDIDSPLQGHKRKGRHSNWNPQHLLLLQAHFASSLRQTSEAKYIIKDLSSQERMLVSRFTGLSMTTISHWLANVKYQLRRTGRTKFLKNLDSGQPTFFCSDCASQIRTPVAYVHHLEAHLGFKVTDLAKMSSKLTVKDSQSLTGIPLECLLSPNLKDDCCVNGAVYHCRLCVRKFATKHAIKLHLSKSHGKSPEDHVLYLCELEKHT